MHQMRKGRGLPANYNPFLVIANRGVDDDTLEKLAPQYFYFRSSSDLPAADSQAKTPFLTQKDAEELVRRLAVGDTKQSFAVREECRHIIPEDLRKTVPVAKVIVDIYYNGSFCSEEDIYFLDQ